jgi:vacuolar-type H+-ATPase subunit E/Vma4
MELNLEANSIKEKFAKSKAAEGRLETVVAALQSRFQLTGDDVRKLAASP